MSSIPEQAGEGADRARRAAKDGWRLVIAEVREAIKDHDLFLVAGGIAFYILLGLFPAFLAVSSVFGSVVGEDEAEGALQSVTTLLPDQLSGFASSQLESFVGTGSGRLGLALVVGVAAAFWATSTGMNGLIRGLDEAYGCSETRGFVHRRLLALGLTAGALVLTMIALAAVALAPGYLGELGLSPGITLALRGLRWVAVALLAMGALAVLYRVGPNRNRPTWKWSSWGAVLAVIAWILASIALTAYLSLSGSFQEQYGALAGPVALLLWVFVTSFIVLLGAEINAALERGRKETAGEEATGRAAGDEASEAAA